MSSAPTHITIKAARLELAQGDITRQDTDAIVNAANSSLLGGGGVDGAIHRAGGPTILAECKHLGGCPTGEARITGAGNLPARYVIHAVGPVYSGKPGQFDAGLLVKRLFKFGADRRVFSGTPEEDAALLAGAYRSSLELASQHGARSIAFPSISTGAYGYPVREAAPIALATVAHYLQHHPEIDLVRFVLFDERTFDGYQHALQHLSASESASEKEGATTDALDS